jgi:hypothetical protein
MEQAEPEFVDRHSTIRLSRGGNVASSDNEVWSLYGAPWLQPVATGRKWSTRENREINPKTVAVSCDQLRETFHGKEGVDGSSPSEGFEFPPA